MSKNFALIIGGGGGFGTVLAKALVERDDYELALVDINLERLKTVATTLGSDVPYFQVDVSDEGSVKKLFEDLEDVTDRIDSLIAAHGLTAGETSIQEASLVEWNAVMTANLTGVFLCMRHVIPIMTKQSSGCIINLTTGNPSRKSASTYIASKIGVEGLTAAAAEDLRESHIGVYAVAPGGYTNTLFHDNSYQMLHYKNYVSSSELRKRRHGLKPEVIVPLCLHLMQDRSLAMTGKKLVAVEWNRQHGLGSDVWYG